MIWYRRYGPQFAWLLLDLTFFMVSAALACWLLQRQPDGAGLAVIAMMTVVRLWFFVQTGMYRAVLRYSGVHSLVLLCAGIALGSVFGTFAGFFAFLEDIGGLGRRFIVIEGLVAMALSGGSRFAIRYASESSLRSRGERVLVLGAGETGEQVVRSLRRSVRFRPVGMVDDDPQRRGAVIHGIRVLGRLDELEAVVKRQNPARLVVAQELPAEQLRALFQRCMDLDLRLTVVRGVGEALDGNDEVQLADIPLEDLLRRPRRNLDREPVARLLAGQVVAVTGAGGSIGSDLCRQVVQAGAASVVLIDSSEAALYQVDRAIRDLCQSVHVIPVLLDLTEAPRLRRCLERHRPAVVFHAAAYK
ncbi:MAG: SDR family NAD(P)-dependent oxidoreductase, partial [Planctomycetota bacterium]|nr:SDR family NAD(P)-dependent oxidoreductase [Planctomycetota bacterium]